MCLTDKVSFLLSNQLDQLSVDFGYRHKLLADRLLSQGYEVRCLRSSLKNFMADVQISLGSIREDG